MIRLTSSDETMLKAALNGGFHLATEWYFDWDPLDYQYVFHYLPIKNTTNVMGIGAGKTSMVAASYLTNCMTYPGFRALNASVTAKQAELAFEMVDAWLETHSRLARFVTDKTLRPYPILRFGNASTFEFRTAGQGAKFIRGHEYDRINYDEAGLDEDGEAIRVLRGRLRGTRIDGSPRMARLDVTGTPTPAVRFVCYGPCVHVREPLRDQGGGGCRVRSEVGQAEHFIQAEADHLAELQQLSFHGHGTLGDLVTGLDVHDQLDVVIRNVGSRTSQERNSHDRFFSDVGKDL
jgi:hypothetical protein